MGGRAVAGNTKKAGDGSDTDAVAPIVSPDFSHDSDMRLPVSA